MFVTFYKRTHSTPFVSVLKDFHALKQLIQTPLKIYPLTDFQSLYFTFLFQVKLSNKKYFLFMSLMYSLRHGYLKSIMKYNKNLK